MAKIKENSIHFRAFFTWNETIMYVISMKQLVMASMYCYWCNHFVIQISYKIQSLNFSSFYFILCYFCSIYHSNLFISIYPSIYVTLCFYRFEVDWMKMFLPLDDVTCTIRFLLFFFCFSYSIESWLLSVVCSAMELDKKSPEWLFYIYCITQLYDFIVYQNRYVIFQRLTLLICGADFCIFVWVFFLKYDSK